MPIFQAPSLSKLRFNIGTAAEAAGNYFNLPEYGVSERIAGQSTPYTGVDRSFASAPLYRQTTAGQSALAEAYAAAAQKRTLSQQSEYSAGTPVPGPTGVDPSTPQNLLESPPTYQDPGDLDISQGLSALEQAEAAARASFEAESGRISSTGQSETTAAQNELARAEAAGQAGKARGEQELTRATNEERRLASELQQGIQARYGKTTGTGEFISEILGSTAMRSIANYRNTYQNLVGELDLKVEQSRQDAASRIREVNDWVANTTQGLKAKLQQTLSEISGGRQQLNAAQYAARAEAMKNYKSLVQEISSRNTAFLQDLYKQQQANEAKWAAAKQTALTKSLALEQQANQFVISRLTDLAKAGKIGPAGKQKLATSLGLPSGAGFLSDEEDTLEDYLQLGSQPTAGESAQLTY